MSIFVPLSRSRRPSRRPLRTALVAVFALIVAASGASAAVVASVPMGPACLASTFDEAFDQLETIGESATAWEIRLVGASTFLGHRFVYGGARDLSIRGGFETCVASEPTGSSRFDANGSVGSIFEIARDQGAPRITVRFVDLNIDHPVANFGGGLHVSGPVDVDILRSTVFFGEALFGGAIYVDGRSGTPTVTLRDTRLVGNKAQFEGGGIFCVGEGRVVLEGSTDVFANRATGVGGGLRGTQGCRIEITGEATLESNRASGGGALALATAARADLVADEAGQPLLGRNVALGPGGSGGAILVTSEAVVVATDVLFEENRAEAGLRGGAFAVEGEGSRLDVDATPGCIDHCSRIVGSEADFGAVADVAEGGALRVVRTFVGNNAPGSGVNADGRAPFWVRSGGRLELDGALVTANLGFKAMVEVFGDATATLRSSTLAGNAPTSASLRVRQDEEGQIGALAVESSIVHHPDRPVYGVHPGADVTSRCLVANDDAGVVGPTNRITDDPGFVDFEGFDFSLRPDAAAVDLCDGPSGELVDVRGQVRGQDDPERIDGLGPVDSGAFERHVAASPFFADGFESGDASAWS